MATTIQRRTEQRAAGRDFQPLAQNAYRVLGLTSAATQSEIYEAAAALRLTLKLGVAKTFAGDMSWLGAVGRGETEIRDAVSRLTNPSQRIFERLFWFAERADALHIAPVTHVNELRAAASRLIVGETRTSRHDAALLSLATVLRLDAEMNFEAAWARALSLWKEVVDSDDYWPFLIAADLKGDFEPLAAYAEVRELRARTLRVVTAPVAARAKDALAREDFRLCRRALTVLRAASLPEKLYAEYENDILSPVEDRIEETCRSVFAWAHWASRNQSNLSDRIETYGRAFSDYEQRLRPLLKRIFDLAGADSHVARRGFESAALNLNDLATYYTDIGDANLASIIFQAAWKLAPPESATLRLIEESREAAGDDDPARRDAEKTAESYAAVLAAELRPTTQGQPGLFTQFTDLPQPKPNESFPGNLLWIGLGLLMCTMFTKCENSGSRSRSGRYPSSVNFNYNMPVPRFSPLPRLDPLILQELEPIQPPRAVKKKKRASQTPRRHDVETRSR